MDSEKRKLETDDNDGSEGKKQKNIQYRTSTTTDSAVPITINMPCPQVKVRSVIGKKGCVIAEIIRESGCKIQIDQNFPEGFPRQIQLTGTPNTLSVAMQMITKIIETPEPGDSLLNHTPSADDFYVPHEKVGSVIGHKGANISEIMRRTGCRIQIVQEGVPDGQDRLVTFSGTQKQTAEAKEMVMTIINEGSSSLLLSSISAPTAGQDDGSSSGSNVMTMMAGTGGLSVYEEDIDPKKVRVVIGQKGSTVSQIERKSGCRRILLNQKFPAGMPHKIIYTGTPQQIEVAKQLVMTVIAYGDEALQDIINGGGVPGVVGSAQDNYVMQEMNVFQSQMVRLLGPHGSNVSNVQNQCGVKINIDTTPVMMMNSATGGPNIGPSGFPEATNKVTVIGSASESVQLAVKMLYEFIGILIAAPPVPQPPQQLQQQQQMPTMVMTPQGYVPMQPAPLQPTQQMGGQGQMMAMMSPAPPQSLPVFGGMQPSAVNSVGYSTVPAASNSMFASQQVPQMMIHQQYAPMVPQQQQQFQHMSPVVVPPTASSTVKPPAAVNNTVLALGQDGTSGQLEPLSQLTNGNYQQIAEINANAIAKLLGKQNANIALIKSKSGASLQVMKPDPARRGSTKIFMTGTQQMVSLASQMIQEVLVNGTGKLMQMVDVAVPSGGAQPPPIVPTPMPTAPFLGGGVPQQQQQMNMAAAGYYQQQPLPMQPQMQQQMQPMMQQMQQPPQQVMYNPQQSQYPQQPGAPAMMYPAVHQQHQQQPMMMSHQQQQPTPMMMPMQQTQQQQYQQQQMYKPPVTQSYGAPSTTTNNKHY